MNPFGTESTSKNLALWLIQTFTMSSKNSYFFTFKISRSQKKTKFGARPFKTRWRNKILWKVNVRWQKFPMSQWIKISRRSPEEGMDAPSSSRYAVLQLCRNCPSVDLHRLSNKLYRMTCWDIIRPFWYGQIEYKMKMTYGKISIGCRLILKRSRRSFCK